MPYMASELPLPRGCWHVQHVPEQEGSTEQHSAVKRSGDIVCTTEGFGPPEREHTPLSAGTANRVSSRTCATLCFWSEPLVSLVLARRIFLLLCLCFPPPHDRAQASLFSAACEPRRSEVRCQHFSQFFEASLAFEPN
jgi:hypothetical protein